MSNPRPAVYKSKRPSRERITVAPCRTFHGARARIVPEPPESERESGGRGVSRGRASRARGSGPLARRPSPGRRGTAPPHRRPAGAPRRAPRRRSVTAPRDGRRRRISRNRSDSPKSTAPVGRRAPIRTALDPPDARFGRPPGREGVPSLTPASIAGEGLAGPRAPRASYRFGSLTRPSRSALIAFRISAACVTG